MYVSKINLTPELFERIDSQLKGFHEEISILSKKNPDGKINTFKIQYINAIIEQANELLQKEYIPLLNFTHFDTEMLPSNSDVVFVLSQYINCMEQLRSENISRDVMGVWYWDVDGKQSNVRTAPPKKLSI